MLSSSELVSLQDLLNDDTKTFEDLGNQFNHLFDNSIHFKIGLTLNILIKDHQLNLFQEISSFYILHHISEQEKNFSSFSSLALEMLKETKIKHKKIILKDFLTNNINKQMKIKEYIELIEKNKNLTLNEDDIKSLEIKIMSGESNKAYNKINNLDISPFIHEKKINNSKINNKDNIIQFAPGPESFNFFESNYMSYYPYKNNNEKLFANELNWIMPMLKHNFIWENSSYEKVNFLLNQVLKDTPLTKEENKYIISSILKNQNLIKCINFTPEKMMHLIEKDEALSFEILAIICKTSLNE
jgi:hypothetical protein